MARYLNKGRLPLQALVLILGIILVSAGVIRSLDGMHGKGSLHPSTADELRLVEGYFSGINILRSYCSEREIEINAYSDPNRTGFIGEEISEITTSVGSLISKRTSTNPQWILWLYRQLRSLGTGPGDIVALNLSGSFPALNLASILAVEACGAEPVIISSVGASTWGANRTMLSWPDLETLFFEYGLIKHRSHAASLGGDWDRGPVLFSEGRRMAADAVERNGIPLLESISLQESVGERFCIFTETWPLIFINVGGNHPALGACPHSLEFRSGLVLDSIECGHEQQGLLHLFTDAGVPVIHMLNLVFLAEAEGIKVDPVPLPFSSGHTLFSDIQ